MQNESFVCPSPSQMETYLPGHLMLLEIAFGIVFMLLDEGMLPRVGPLLHVLPSREEREERRLVFGDVWADRRSAWWRCENCQAPDLVGSAWQMWPIPCHQWAKMVEVKRNLKSIGIGLRNHNVLDLGLREGHIPQVSVLPYWYNIDTQETIFDAPERHMEAKVLPSAWTIEVGRSHRWTFRQRATCQTSRTWGVASVESYWYDVGTSCRLGIWNLYSTSVVMARLPIQHLLVLHWGTWSKSNYGRRDKGGYFGPQSDEAKKLFAHDSFFAEVAALASQRFQQIHPINLVYLLWTFTRAGVSAQKFFNDAADHFCDGLLPSLDRCGLCTLVWCYSRQRIRHDRLFPTSSSGVRTYHTSEILGTQKLSEYHDCLQMVWKRWWHWSHGATTGPMAATTLGWPWWKETKAEARRFVSRTYCFDVTTSWVYSVFACGHVMINILCQVVVFAM